jgi:ketosteroid isomerase-like protein
MDRVLLILLAAVPLFQAQPDRAAMVLAVLHRACDAFRDGDVRPLEGFLAPGFTLTDSSGKVTGREANLAEVRAREPRYEIFRNHTMSVRFYGDTALVNGITSVKGVSSGQPFEADFRFTDTLVLKDGVWMLAASHASRIAK